MYRNAGRGERVKQNTFQSQFISKCVRNCFFVLFSRVCPTRNANLYGAAILGAYYLNFCRVPRKKKPIQQ